MRRVSEGMSWSSPRPLAEMTTDELGEVGRVFHHDGFLYRTTGKRLGNGGMGNVFLLARKPAHENVEPEPSAGKIFHSEYLYQLRTDEITRRDHESVLRNIGRISAIGHPNLLTTYASVQIPHNHLTISPHRCETLRQAIASRNLSVRQRLELLIGALNGLAALHEARYIHRDVTLRNILVDNEAQNAYLFDFDLALSLDEVAGVSYKTRYQGRIFGSPGYSVPPEILDAALMESAITPRLDIYAVGGAIFNLFSDRLPYGKTEDMWGLLLRISDGIVLGGKSRIEYPDSVPNEVRPVIEKCLERDPGNRYGSVSLVIRALEKCVQVLATGRTLPPPRSHQTLIWGDDKQRVQSVHKERRDSSITKAVIEVVDEALVRYGYLVHRALGRVKEYPIFLVAPNPELVAHGEFSDSNTYPKIVTALDLNGVPRADEIVDLWLGGYLPILRAARQGLLTSLHRVVFDQPSGFLLLFSEYVDDARFGSELDKHELTLKETLGLGFLVARQVRRLHKRGMAHNNIAASSLLLKGLRDTREVHPAMVGIVSPTLDAADMTTDVLRLAALIMSWIRVPLIEALEPVLRTRLAGMYVRLQEISGADPSVSRSISGLLDVLADGLSAIDFNFGVLRENMGDLDAYSLLLVSHSLYGRLWDQ